MARESTLPRVGNTFTPDWSRRHSWDPTTGIEEINREFNSNIQTTKEEAELKLLNEARFGLRGEGEEEIKIAFFQSENIRAYLSALSCMRRRLTRSLSYRRNGI